MVVEMSVKQNWHEHVFPIENRVKELCSEARRLGAWINRLAFPLVDIQIHEHTKTGEWIVELIFQGREEDMDFAFFLDETEENFKNWGSNLPEFLVPGGEKTVVLPGIETPSNLVLQLQRTVGDPDDRHAFAVQGKYVWALLQVLERLEKEFEINEEQAVETSEFA